MVDRAAREFMRRFATDDVRSTVRWLVTNGFELARSEFGASDWSGLLVFRGGAEVHIGLERSQWFMRIAPGPEDPPIDYDLLAVAQRGQAYWDVIPRAGGEPAAPPRQLPPGLSWHDTLPDVLAWIAGHEVSQAVALAQDQRYAVMWPDPARRGGCGEPGSRKADRRPARRRPRIVAPRGPGADRDHRRPVRARRRPP